MLVKYSLIIPCYNEENNIDSLIKKSINLLKQEFFELILVNNGSKDKTLIKINSHLKNYTNIKCVDIKTNIGFGFGVFQGLKEAKGQIVGYTHADLQTDPNDFMKAINIIKSKSLQEKNFFIKGLRHGRSFIDIFFTKSMTLYTSLIFNMHLFDINAQPVVFKRELLNQCAYFPNNFTIDLYLYYLAKKNNYFIERFKVNFIQRVHGLGNNDSFIKKIKNSFVTIFQSLILRFKIFFK